jgi:hypothetical protein
MFTIPLRVLTTGALVCAPLAVGLVPATGLSAGSDWSPRTVLSTSGAQGVDDVVSGDGAMAATWARAGHIELARRTAAGVWGATETVVAHGAAPQLEVDLHGTLYLVWSVRGRAWRMMEKHSLPGGGWSPAVRVLRHAGLPVLVDYDVAANGAAVAAVRTGTNVLVQRRSPTGSWSAPTRWTRVADVDVALGGRGLAAAVLTRFLPSTHDSMVGTRVVLVTRQRVGGSWSTPFVLQRERGQTMDPGWPGPAGVTVDPAGTATVAWYGTVPRHPRPGVAGSRAQLGRAWSAPRLVIPRMGSEQRIGVAAARDGSVLVVAVRDYSTVFSARRPPHAAWLPPVTVAPRGRFISGWDVARDRAGGAVVAWTRCQGPGYACSGVWAKVMSPRGVWGPQARLGWPPVPDGESTWAAMGHGEALVAWSRYDPTAGHSSLLARTR